MHPTTTTNPDRIRALQSFGYTMAEAQFLLLPALHGGYFLRRQYVQFLGKEDGGTITHLVQKAAALNHVRATTWRQNTQLYHLCARPFYEAIGQGNNRNRRMREINAIKVKIMALDFVLRNRDKQYLATDQEKFDCFVGLLGIGVEDLPAIHYKGKTTDDVTTRYFVEKFPIYLNESAGTTPEPAFCFIDEGLAGLSAFDSFLDRYRRLFSSLKAFELIYVAASSARLEAAKRRFECVNHRGAQALLFPLVSPAELPRILDYFAMRRAYETGSLAEFDREKLIRFRNGRERFSGKEFELLFKVWKNGGDSAVKQVLTQKPEAPRATQGRFSSCLLDHDYGLFATVFVA